MNDVEIIMLPVSAGDATLLIHSDRGKRYTVLIDSGLKKDEALSYLKLRKISHLDLVILSHPDMDHLGGLLSIIETMAVDQIWCFNLTFLREFVETGKIPQPKPGTH